MMAEIKYCSPGVPKVHWLQWCNQSPAFFCVQTLPWHPWKGGGVWCFCVLWINKFGALWIFCKWWTWSLLSLFFLWKKGSGWAIAAFLSRGAFCSGAAWVDLESQGPDQGLGCSEEASDMRTWYMSLQCICTPHVRLHCLIIPLGVGLQPQNLWERKASYCKRI